LSQGAYRLQESAFSRAVDARKHRQGREANINISISFEILQVDTLKH
jgi:hypothetical protein